jgi:uncharacterized delta-60 repeat protein
MKNRLFLILFALLAGTAMAQPGANDPTFNTFDDGTFSDHSDFNGRVETIAIQPDGKILVGGIFTDFRGTTVNRIARLNSEGILDTGFNSGIGFNHRVRSILAQSDGKIIVGGVFSSFNGTTRNRIARLNADGSLDTGFNVGTGFDYMVQTIAIQADGKIIVGGDFTSYNGTAINRIARLNVDGSIDTSFNPGTGFSGSVYSIAIQSDGKIIVGGNFNSYNGNGSNRIARLNEDGSFDTGFNVGTGFSNTVWITVLQTDGKILVGGDFIFYNSTGTSRLVRLNTDGSLDTSFNIVGSCNNDVYSISIQSDGKILVGGDFTNIGGNVRNRIARLNTDGTIDLGFNPIAGFTNAVWTTAIQSDGRIIVGGDFTSFNSTSRRRIAGLDSNGNLDMGFNLISGFNTVVNTISLQSDGKTIVGGDFVSFNGIAINGIARLNTDGSLDTTFNPGTGFNGRIFSMAIQPDGKIIVGGDFTSFNGTARNRIARLNSDGSIDTSFNIGSGSSNIVYTTTLQSDGKIILGGWFANFNGIGRNRIARLNADGSLDLCFNPGTGFNSWVRTTSIQSDGKIIVGGDFTYFNGTPRNNIARLNSDGSLDTGFDPGSGCNHRVRTSSIQSDGKIVIGGDFSSVNGTGRNCIARLNTDGSLDIGFNPGTGFDIISQYSGVVYSLALQSDGKVIVVGNFTSYNGTSRNNIARLNTDGSLDFDFFPGTGFDLEVSTSAIQSDGRIIVGGRFKYFNGFHRNFIARVFSECTHSFETEAIVTCEPYTWINGITYTTSNNTATHTFVEGAANGCDSIVALNLTIYNSYSNIENVAICDGQVFPWRGNNLTIAGTYYDTLFTALNCDSIVTFVLNLEVNQCFEFIENEAICFGDIFTWRGNSYTLPGTYYDSLLTVNNFDSVYVLNLNVNPLFEFVVNEVICVDSIFIWRGNSYNQPGTYYDSLLSIHNCDSIYVLHLTENPLPNVSITGLDTSYCDYHSAVTLTGSPSGGTFSGQGVAGNVFDPALAGVGTWAIVYSYSDCYTCTNSDTVFVEVSDCVGIETSQKQGIKLFPNPNDGKFIIELHEESNITVINSLGAPVHRASYAAGSHSLDLSYLPSGVYLIKSESKDNVNVLRVVISPK